MVRRSGVARASLLVELLTEELPPKRLKHLQIFAQTLRAGLVARGFCGEGAPYRPFATPRRLGVLVSDVVARQADRIEELRGPKVDAFYRAGQPVESILIGLARKYGLEPAELAAKARTVTDSKGDYVVFGLFRPGEFLAAVINEVIGEAVAAAKNGAKHMRWGNAGAEFMRPVHRLVVLHGKSTVAATVLGVASGRATRGHRFRGRGEIKLRSADSYVEQLERDGCVVADFEQRRALIEHGLDAAAGSACWRFGDWTALLDEVTGLVEYPVVYVGTFDEVFLKVPKECLIISMRQHQKYFPLQDIAGKVLPRFLFVSNLAVASPEQIVRGNERVLRARLSDAKFFFDQDRKVRLDQRVARLEQVVYHNRLGSQLERVKRITKLAGAIGSMIGANGELVRRAAYLCKADLLTDMVGEFPELQGVMGRHYAVHDAEPKEVADAIEAHYRPRHAGDALPEGHVAHAVALADKLDILAGIYAIGLGPSGDKDPFGLRRHTLGIARILIEARLPLDIVQLIGTATSQFPPDIVSKKLDAELHAFVLDRVRGYLRERDYHSDEIEAVLGSEPSRFDDLLVRMEAVRAFRAMPEAASLAAANKRIRNILKKTQVPIGSPDAELLIEAVEKNLYSELQQRAPEIEALFEAHDYAAALRSLAVLRQPVDAFFDEVMVMVENEGLRHNRLRLLTALAELMNRVADISRLEY